MVKKLAPGCVIPHPGHLGGRVQASVHFTQFMHLYHLYQICLFGLVNCVMMLIDDDGMSRQESEH